jgi:hypothetical protein
MSLHLFKGYDPFSRLDGPDCICATDHTKVVFGQEFGVNSWPTVKTSSGMIFLPYHGRQSHHTVNRMIRLSDSSRATTLAPAGVFCEGDQLCALRGGEERCYW